MANYVIEKRMTEDRLEMLRRKKEKEEAHLYMNVGSLTKMPSETTTASI